ncbi:MAG: hypothetical protein ABSF37_03620 [Sedimentisphaerales bacterium]|jgi:hypothetical protein
MTTPKNIRETIKANYLQPAFLICVCLLAITTVSMSKFSRHYEPLPLKKSLSDLDKSNLAPYKVVEKSKIENQDILNTLGTEDYIQWALEDTSAPAESKTRFCTLFITYYSLPDIVPHRPEECYIGGGLQGIKFETVMLKAINGVYERDIKTRYLVFADTKSDILTGGTSSFPILYTFRVNGKYGDRYDVRNTLNWNSFSKYSYFSKVEWKFYNIASGRTIYPNKQEAIAASEKLMSVILPVLEKEHWPSGHW